MNLAQTSAVRKWIGLAGTVLCVFFLLSVFDAIIVRGRQPSNYLSCLPGRSLAVTAPLPEKTGNTEELTYLTDSEEVRAVFDGVQTGFWVGGRMWRGRIVVGPRAQPGLHEVKVSVRDGTGVPSTFRVEVFMDGRRLRGASLSYIRRYFGASPWTAAILLGSLIVPTFGVVFFYSERASRLMEREGKAEIWRVEEVEKGYEVHFGLGLNQGIRQGEVLALLDRKQQPRGCAIVQEVFRDHSVALAGSESLVKPGFSISRST